MVHGSEAANSYTGWFYRGNAMHSKGLRPLVAACGWVNRLWPGQLDRFLTLCACVVGLSWFYHGLCLVAVLARVWLVFLLGLSWLYHGFCLVVVLARVGLVFW